MLTDEHSAFDLKGGEYWKLRAAVEFETRINITNAFLCSYGLLSSATFPFNSSLHWSSLLVLYIVWDWTDV